MKHNMISRTRTLPACPYESCASTSSLNSAHYARRSGPLERWTARTLHGYMPILTQLGKIQCDIVHQQQEIALLCVGALQIRLTHRRAGLSGCTYTLDENNKPCVAGPALLPTPFKTIVTSCECSGQWGMAIFYCLCVRDGSGCCGRCDAGATTVGIPRAPPWTSRWMDPCEHPARKGV